MMLADPKLDSMVMHLEQFKLIDQNRQTDLENLLKAHSQLLSDYKTLRNAYEQQKDVIDQQKHLFNQQKEGRAAALKHLLTAPTQKTQNPYVLMLVDGNGYVFNDELIREKEAGGMRTARMLNDAVERYLQQCLPDSTMPRIIIRIYANLTTVSKQLGRSGVTGMEKRSLGSFSAAFTKAISLCDYVDALDEDGTRLKIKEQFQAASEDSNCRHILYAACHDNAYIPQLVPFRGLRDKITLVQGAGWDPAFHQFNLNITQFPTVFRWSDLPSATSVSNTPSTNGFSQQSKSKSVPKPVSLPTSNHPSHLHDSWRSPKADTTANAAPSWDDLPPRDENDMGVVGSVWENVPVNSPRIQEEVCKYFRKGCCRYGNKCSFLHDEQNLDGGSSPDMQTPTAYKRHNIAASLPINGVPGHVLLNKYGQRLDVYVRPPSTREWQIYNVRFSRMKPCNSWHLQRTCKSFDCSYDHNELEPEALHVLEYVLRSTPCPKRSACRIENCFYGHICQRDGCGGQTRGCRLKPDLHNVHPKMHSAELAEEEEGEEEEEEEEGLLIDEALVAEGEEDERSETETSEDANLMW